MGVEGIAAQPSSGLPVGESAGSPAEAVTEGEDDIAPPVLGVPPSSGDEEELLADRAGAPLFPDIDVADGEAQTEHIAPILTFDGTGVPCPSRHSRVEEQCRRGRLFEGRLLPRSRLSPGDRARIAAANATCVLSPTKTKRKPPRPCERRRRGCTRIGPFPFWEALRRSRR